MTRDVLAAHLPPPTLGAKTKVLVCGPPGFVKGLAGEKKSPADQGELAGVLKAMGYDAAQAFKF